jgi:hypothetical protein
MPPRAPEPVATLSPVTRLGSLLGAGAVASLAASIPAAARVARETDGRFGVTGAWLALAAATLVPMIVAVAVLRGARRGALLFGVERAGPRALGFAVWLLASALVLLFFGAALRATTHHHALAGATYALVALVVAAGLAGVVSRFVALAAGWGALAERLVLGAVACGLLATLLFFSSKVSRTSPAAAALLVDVLACVLAAGLASGPMLAGSRAFAVLGPPFAAAVLLLGLGGLREAPKLPAVVRTRAPLMVGPVDCTAQLVRKR